jgi:hypothetical protein
MMGWIYEVNPLEDDRRRLVEVLKDSCVGGDTHADSKVIS